MSYCRWSSDDWKCDLYCYEHVGGYWATHVASNKTVPDPPVLPNILTTPNEEWLTAYRAQMAFLETAERFNLGLPYDGQSFEDPDLESFRARVVMLKAAGYRCPDAVIDAIDEEIKLRDEELTQMKADAEANRATVQSSGEHRE